MSGSTAEALTGLLTAQELELVDLLGRCATDFSGLVGDGPSRTGDLTEFVHHIHACQNQLLAQAAARAYPDHFRLLGDPR